MRFAQRAAVLLLSCGAVSLAADEAPLLFSDNFATLSPAWGPADSSHSVASGKLVIQPAANRVYTTLYGGRTFGDVDVSVTIRQSTGDADETAGIAFWGTDTDNCYLAQISSDGVVGVTRWMHDEQVNPVDYRVNDAVVKGIGQENTLRVVTVGNRAALYVNHRLITALRGFPPTGGSKIGVHAESGTTAYTWQFSSLQVRNAEAAEMPLKAAALPAAAAVVFTDDFSALDPSWGISSATQHVADGKFVFQPEANSGRTTLYCGSMFSQADIRATLCETQGTTDATAGLGFWATDAANCYIAQLRADGLFGVTRLQNNNQLTPVSFDVRDAINKGIGQKNVLRVVTIANCAAVYINNRLIVAFKGFPPQGLSQLGFHGESNDQLCIWQFSDFSVRKPELDDVAILIPATLADDVLFADDFATLDPAWGDADGVQSVTAGMLVLEPAAGTSYASLYQGALFDDADLRVKISETTGGTDQPAGIIFWATDYKNYYVAQIVPGRSPGISRIKDGVWSAPASDAPAETTNPSDGKTSALRVVLKGDSATFSINNRQIAAIKGEPPKGGSKIGVRAASGGSVKFHWQFDELVVCTVE